MAEEIIFKLGVDTGDSAAQVGAIDKEFDALRKSIKDAEKEVDNLSKDFGANSQQAEAARKKLSNLNLSYKELSKAATDVSAKFEDVYGELQPLTTRMGEAEDRLYELALAGKTNTKEYQDLLETVARYRQTQIETDRVVDSAAQTFTQKLGGAIQGAANGYAVVQGAMGLFGTESKELEEALLKVQSAMALAQGIEGVRTALPLFKDLANTIKTGLVGAFSSLKGAIASTGIGLLVIGIGILISKMMDYFKTTEEIIKQNERLLISNNRIIAQIGKRREKLDEDMNKQLAYAEAMGKSDEDLYNIKKKFSDKSIKANNDEIQTRLDNVKKLKEIDLGVQASSKEQYLELVKANKQKIVAEWERINELKKINSKANDDVKIAQIKLNNENKEEQEKANETAKQNRQAEYKRQLDEIHQNNLKKIELENARIIEQENLENEYYDSLKSQQDLEVQAVRDKYFKIIQTTKDNEVLLLAQQKELDAIALKYQEEKDAVENERKNNIANQEEEFMNSYYDAITNSVQKEKDAINEKYFYLTTKAEEYGLSTIELERQRVEELNKLDEVQAESKRELANAIGGIFGELAGLSKQASNIQKAFAITQVAIDTATALSGLTAISFSPTNGDNVINPLGPYIKLATGTAKIISNMARVKGILGSGVSVTPPTIGGANANLGASATGGTQPQQQIQAQSTYKVVVVDSDITNMQNKTKKVKAISTI